MATDVVSALLSVVISILVWNSTSFPTVLPVLGLALGANAVFSNTLTRGGYTAFWLGFVGVALSGTVSFRLLVS